MIICLRFLLPAERKRLLFPVLPYRLRVLLRQAFQQQNLCLLLLRQQVRFRRRFFSEIHSLARKPAANRSRDQNHPHHSQNGNPRPRLYFLCTDKQLQFQQHCQRRESLQATLKLSTIIIFFSKKYNVFSEEDSGKSCQKTFCEAARFV